MSFAITYANLVVAFKSKGLNLELVFILSSYNSSNTITLHFKLCAFKYNITELVVTITIFFPFKYDSNTSIGMVVSLVFVESQ